MPTQVAKPTPAASTSKVAAELPADFSKEQAKKAVKALLAHHTKDKQRQEEKTLISKDEHVWLVVNTRRMPTKKSLKPSRMYVRKEEVSARQRLLTLASILLPVNSLTLLFLLRQQLRSVSFRRTLNDSTRTFYTTKT
jgi:hypothetical protein